MYDILMIEDDEIQLALQRSILMDAGYTVHATADGPQGILIFKKHKIDLVLLDLGIPSMSGLDVLQELKKIDPSVNVIVITGIPSVESSGIAMKFGARDYIEKPVDVQYFLKRIKSILQNNISTK